ncbi:metallophosphoesterase [Geitlerinema sp. PCC 7407]|uniref:metallophosphoesterase n=1 Tax=Geitlerinema sp. PCC 7407 TaxID=1173025 RepID=UPI00029FEEEB|nr:metallophosphoesterase [Geitlerinema sp. PCC 7407]AFY65114.1 metallophosphoesterase [Geitlerinema sp. PCC 7407]
MLQPRTGRLKVEHITVAIADLAPALVGTRIVQLSDFHYDGLRLSDRLLEQAIAAANAAEPDLIVLTGDFVTYESAPVQVLAPRLRSLRSRTGVFASLGNHDYWHGVIKPFIAESLAEAGIHVLRNQVAYPLGEAIALVGLGDLRSREFRPEAVLDTLPPTTPRLVLSHNPDTAETLQQWRVDLQLAGHTHGGQVILPGLGALPAYVPFLRRITPPCLSWLPYMKRGGVAGVRHWEWGHGFHRIGQNQLYVNRGLGTYLPGRLGCPPEVTVLTLVPAVPGDNAPAKKSPRSFRGLARPSN